jgi:hypothetical protein
MTSDYWWDEKRRKAESGKQKAENARVLSAFRFLPSAFLHPFLCSIWKCVSFSPVVAKPRRS